MDMKEEEEEDDDDDDDDDDRCRDICFLFPSD
jgi:hypothetical protein